MGRGLYGVPFFTRSNVAKKKDQLPVDLFTPLQVYAHQAHEFYTALQDAGFTEGEAWDLLLRQLPDWEIEAPDFLDDIEEDEEDVDEE